MPTALWIGLVAFAALVPLSVVVEALRQKPAPPAALAWAPEIPQLFAEIDGVRIRYVRTGSGPTLVLLHALRTQLDIFQKVIPTLAREFTLAPEPSPHFPARCPTSVVMSPRSI
jgi:hypothetical protein